MPTATSPKVREVCLLTNSDVGFHPLSHVSGKRVVRERLTVLAGIGDTDLWCTLGAL